MLEAIRAKFTQHLALAQLLLSTGDHEIIEHSDNDYYWSCGKDGSGQNMIGKILVKIRAELR